MKFVDSSRESSKPIPDLAKVKIGVGLVGGFPSLTFGFDGLDSFSIGKVFGRVADAWKASAPPAWTNTVRE